MVIGAKIQSEGTARVSFAEIFCKPIGNDSEDLLTSEVFATFRYLPPNLGIIRFIRSIEDLNTRIPEPDAESTCEYYFWPVGKKLRKVPDLLLELGVKDKVYHILIEAKYRSGASDREEREEIIDGERVIAGNQLAAQYRDLMCGEYEIRTLEAFFSYETKVLPSNKKDRFQLYLTCDPFPPEKEYRSFRRCLPNADARLYWTSFYHIYEFLCQLSKEITKFPESLMLSDTLVLLRHKKFDSFQCIPRPPDLSPSHASGAFWKTK